MDPFTKPQSPSRTAVSGRAACRAPRALTPEQAATRFIDALVGIERHADGGLAGFLVGVRLAEQHAKSREARVAEAFGALGDLVHTVRRELELDGQ